jgi:hypothetical protein
MILVSRDAAAVGTSRGAGAAFEYEKLTLVSWELPAPPAAAEAVDGDSRILVVADGAAGEPGGGV